MVDDATSTSLAIMAEGETTRVVLEALKAWIEKYGIPLALYVDLNLKKSVEICHNSRTY